MGKRGNGEGTLRRRRDGLWEARIALPRDEQGRVSRRSVYGKTRREVAAKLGEAQRRQQDGERIVDSLASIRRRS